MRHVPVVLFSCSVPLPISFYAPHAVSSASLSPFVMRLRTDGISQTRLNVWYSSLAQWAQECDDRCSSYGVGSDAPVSFRKSDNHIIRHSYAASLSSTADRVPCSSLDSSTSMFTGGPSRPTNLSSAAIPATSSSTTITSGSVKTPYASAKPPWPSSTTSESALIHRGNGDDEEDHEC